MLKVSVIIPNFNHSKYLQNRIDSIIQQSYDNYEIIILDDSSTDNSHEILNIYKSHPKVTHVVINKQNSGNTFLQWQKGISLAKGELIWIAESDDKCENTFLEKVLKCFCLNPTIGLAFCQSWKIDEDEKITGNWIEHTKEFGTNLFSSDFIINGQQFVNDYLIHKNVIPNSSAVIFKKVLYEQVSGVSLKFKYCGDWFLWLKLAMIADVAYVAEPLNYFRRHEKSVIRKAISAKRSDLFYLHKTDQKMRVHFQKWLTNQEKTASEITNKNKKYIEDVAVAEANYLLWHGTNFQSIVCSLKLCLINGNFSVLKIPVQRTFYAMIRAIKRLLGLRNVKFFKKA